MMCNEFVGALVSFRSATDFCRRFGHGRKIRSVITAQCGYARGAEMCIAKTADGTEYRLYNRVGDKWCDASLKALPV